MCGVCVCGGVEGGCACVMVCVWCRVCIHEGEQKRISTSICIHHAD